MLVLLLSLLHPKNNIQLVLLNLVAHCDLWEFLTDGNHLICGGKGKSSVIQLLALNFSLQHLEWSTDTLRRHIKLFVRCHSDNEHTKVAAALVRE